MSHPRQGLCKTFLFFRRVQVCRCEEKRADFGVEYGGSLDCVSVNCSIATKDQPAALTTSVNPRDVGSRLAIVVVVEFELYTEILKYC